MIERVAAVDDDSESLSRSDRGNRDLAEHRPRGDHQQRIGVEWIEWQADELAGNHRVLPLNRRVEGADTGAARFQISHDLDCKRIANVVGSGFKCQAPDPEREPLQSRSHLPFRRIRYRRCRSGAVRRSRWEPCVATCK